MGGVVSADKITIYGHQASRASRPYWLLREYGMTINEDIVEVDTGGPVTGFNAVRDSAEFLKRNPYREIPVMVHSDVVLYESQAICQYIAEVLGGPLSGKNLAEKSRIAMYGISSIAKFEPNFLPMVFRQGGEEGRARYEQNLQPLLSGLDAELSDRDYLIGDGRGRFTVADVMMASVVGQYGRAVRSDFYPPRGMKVKPTD